MFLEEARHNVGAESEANTSVVLTPSGDVFVRVGPQEIAEESAIRNLNMSALFLFQSKTGCVVSAGNESHSRLLVA